MNGGRCVSLYILQYFILYNFCYSCLSLFIICNRWSVSLMVNHMFYMVSFTLRNTIEYKFYRRVLFDLIFPQEIWIFFVIQIYSALITSISSLVYYDTTEFLDIHLRDTIFWTRYKYIFPGIETFKKITTNRDIFSDPRLTWVKNNY